MKSFSQYFGEGVSCPEGTRWCTKCSKCLEVPCQDKEIKENNESKREQLLQKKQLMLNRQKLQLQMKQVQKKKQTDMYLNTEGVDRDKEGNDKYDRYKRMVRHKQGKYGVSTLKQRLKHGGVDYNIDNERKARNEDWQKKSGKNAEGGLNEKGSKAKSDSIGKTKAGKHPEGYGETSGTKVRGGKLPKKTNKGAYHYG